MFDYKTLWALGAALTLTTNAYAQDAEAPEASPDAAVEAVEPPAMDAETKARLAELEKMIEGQQARLKALEEAGDAASAKAEELSEKLDAAEMERLELTGQLMEAESGGSGKKFSIFGFMDAGFGYYRYRAEDLLSTYVIREPTFVTSNINLYFKSELTSNLEVLIETGFTFAPQGQEYSLPTAVEIGGNTVTTDGEYERANVSASDLLTARDFNWGGVVIERAHIDYKFYEWLKVRAGRWLTPYGIWNVDHGSPVLVGTSLPQLVAAQLVPNNQTGIQVFGRVFPSDSMKLDYAAFVSNGRGPLEAVLDLDSNKALGLRAKLTMNLGPVEAAVGAFGYHGKYTDETQSIRIQATPGLTLDFENSENPLGARRTIRTQYDETSIAVDIDIRAFDFRLFGEGIVRKVTYSDEGRPAVDSLVYLANGGTLGGDPGLAPDHTGKAGYLILTYDLKADWLKEGSFFRPYAGIERISQNDSNDVFNYTLYRMGLNYHPNPYLVLKFSAVSFNPDRNEILGKFWSYTSQAAVSF